MIITLISNIYNSVANVSPTINNRSFTFAENDPFGLIMALIGMGIVFSALILLFIIFSNTPLLFTQEFKTKLKSKLSLKKPVTIEDKKHNEKKQELSGEINAAIATAIHLYRNELHDNENTVLTIKKVSRRYSPWNSKIYGLRNNPNIR